MAATGSRARGRWAAPVDVAALGAAALALAACAEAPAPERAAAAPECARRAGAPDREPDSILLLLLGSARYSHLSASGYPRATTPFLASLARRGLWFPNAHGASSSPLAALASLLSGLPPGAHGLADAAQGGSARSQLPSLAACLQQAGYRTLALGNDPALASDALARGFDERVVDPDFSAAGMLDELSRWLATARPGPRAARDAREPFFALLHLADARLPYLPRYEYYRAFERRRDAGLAPESYLTEARAAGASALALVQQRARVPQEQTDLLTDLYDAELRQLDDALARLPQLLQQRGAAARTLIALSADHGERLLEKGDLGHGGALDFRTLHVPLVLLGPGIPRGRRDPRLARSLDLFPTLVARAGLAPPAGLPGRDLLADPGGPPDPGREAPRGPGAPAARGGAAPESAFARSGREEMVRAGSFAYYRRADGSAELYDLARDPQERHDLASRRPVHVRWLEAELARWRALELQLAAATELAAAPPAEALP